MKQQAVTELRKGLAIAAKYHPMLSSEQRSGMLLWRHIYNGGILFSNSELDSVLGDVFAQVFYLTLRDSQEMNNYQEYKQLFFKEK